MKVIFSLILITVINVSNAMTVEEILDNADRVMGYTSLNHISSIYYEAVTSMPGGVLGINYSGKNINKTFIKSGGKILIKESTLSKHNKIKRESQKGCDGSNCYSKDSGMGLRLLDGQEKDSLLRQNIFNSWRQLYSQYELIGQEIIDGQQCYKVLLNSQSGSKIINYYNTENYLLVKSDAISSPGFAEEITSHFKYSNYTDIGHGLMMAKSLEINTMAMTLKIEIIDVKINIEMPDEMFKLPDGLR